MPPLSETMDLETLGHSVTLCRRCPRLVVWRETLARQKRAAFRDQEYWARPVPGFGDPAARVLVIGLAPAAHGANRTGRMFTGDRSGQWLYRALHRAGFANRPESVSRDDGLRLTSAWVTAAVRCAPPDNEPTPAERDACRPWLEAELDLLPHVRVIVALGALAYRQALAVLERRGVALPLPRPRFGHLVEVGAPGSPTVLASYHPSQRNTFTGRLTGPMFDRVFARAAELACVERRSSGG
jgi:uracil-DNA glycosylase family 4